MSFTEVILKSQNRGWLVEYSPSQKQFQIESVEEAIRKNLRIMLQGKQVDYLIIGIFDTRDEAGNAYDFLNGEKYAHEILAEQK